MVALSDLDGYDWSVVGRDGNPVPGSGSDVTELARRYNTLFENFDGMADALSRLGGVSGMSGNWTEKFQEKTADLPRDFRGFAQGFEGVHNELVAWGVELDRIQSIARTQIYMATDAYQDQQRYSGDLAWQQSRTAIATSVVDQLPDDAPEWRVAQAKSDQRRAQSLLDDYASKVNSAANDLGAAKIAIDAISKEYADAGDAHAAAIRGSQTAAPRLEGFERAYYSDEWQFAVKVLEAVSIVLAVASLFAGGWVILLASATVGLVLALEKIIEYENQDATGREVIASVFFALLSFMVAFKPVATGIKGLEGAKPAVEGSELSKSMGNVLRNISHHEVHSKQGFGILAHASRLPKNAFESSGIGKTMKTLTKTHKALSSTVKLAAKQWGSARDVLRTGAYYAQRNHVALKVGKSIQLAKPQVMDYVKTGEITITPDKAAERLVPFYGDCKKIGELADIPEEIGWYVD